MAKQMTNHVKKQMPDRLTHRRRAFRLGVAGVAALGAAASLGGCKSGDVRAGAARGSGSVVVAATSAGASSAAAPETSAAAPTASAAAGGGSSACTGTQLSVQEMSPDASVGHRAYVLVFTNKSTSSCTVTGYPGASVADSAGKDVLDARRSLVGYESGPTAITTVKLAPGATASAVVEWDAATEAGADCVGTKGGHLLITAPNTTVSTAFALPTDLCSDFEIHPVQPGGSGRANS